MDGARKVGGWLLRAAAVVVWLFALVLVIVAFTDASMRVVGIVVAVVVAFAGWLVFKLGDMIMHPESSEKKTARKEAGRQARAQLRAAVSEAGAASAAKHTGQGHLQGSDWVPPRPGGTPMEPWGKCVDEIEVVGESHHKDAAREIIRAIGDAYDPESGGVLYEPAVLVLDGHNPYADNGNAIAVFVHGLHVGYLPSPTSQTWAPLLRGLGGDDACLRVKGRTWVKDDDRGVGMRATVTVPSVDALQPPNGFPAEPYIVIPVGSRRQVTKEDEHMDVLKGLVVAGGVNHVAAVLRSITEIRPRSAVETVQVEINGHRVGILTDTQAKNLLPLVTYIEARGKLPVVRADVEGSVLKAEVVLYCAGAAEVDPAWLESLGPETPKPAQVIPRPDWDWDDEPQATIEAAKRQDGGALT